MGTELEHNLNLFTTLPKNNHNVVPVGFNTPDSRITFNKTLLKPGIWSGFKQFQESMDRSLKSHRESVRQTMMKHEEIFKQQVHELHRLYGVQKMLMAEVRNKEVKLHSFRNVTPRERTDTRNRFWSSASTSETSHSYISIRYPSADQLSSENSFLELYNTTAGPSSRGLSSQDPLRIQKGFDLERPAVDDTDTVTQNQPVMLGKHLKEKTSIEGPESCSDGESDIELTLSIGCSSDKKKPKDWLSRYGDLGCSLPTPSETRQLISTTPVRLDGREECSDPSVGFNGEGLQGPPWLFQSLNLNRT